MPGEIWALIGAILFGLSYVAVRKAHEDGWTNLNVLVSMAIVNVICYLAGFAYVAAEGQLPELRWQAIPLFAAAGVFTSVLGRGTMFASIARIGASRASSFRVTSPVVTVAMAYVLLGERMSALALLGTAVVLAGVWLLTYETRGSGGRAAPIAAGSGVVMAGILFGLASAASFGAGQVFRKLGLEQTSLPVLGALVASTVGLVTYGLGATHGGRWRELIKAHRGRFAWPILLAGLLTTTAQLTVFYAYQLAPVSTSSVLGATEPVWTLLAVALVMRRQEAPTRWLALSILVITAGSALVVAG
jgi:drug/metabolite transporter (DMT)-like permease